MPQPTGLQGDALFEASKSLPVYICFLFEFPVAVAITAVGPDVLWQRNGDQGKEKA